MFDFLSAWKGLRFPLFLTLGTLIFGTVGFKFIYPEESLTQLLYMSAITVSTVGYGDILDIHQNTGAIVFTIIFMFAGMGVVLYSTSLVTAYIIEGNLRDAFSIERMKKRIKGMKNHTIICGAGETGSHVIAQMMSLGKECVVIEADIDKKNELIDEFPSLTILTGDATSDLMLEKAGIENAAGLVAALSNDKDNLFLTISAKMLQPQITIVSKAIELTMIKKLKRAGASRVVSPNYIGGIRMASEIIRPHATEFLDQVGDKIQEQIIPGESPLIGKKLSEIDFYGDCGVNILGLSNNRQNYETNLSPDLTIEEGQVLIFFGSSEDTKRVQSVVSP